MEQTDSVGIEGCVFPGVKGMMPQENGQEQCAGVYKLDPDLVTNLQL